METRKKPVKWVKEKKYNGVFHIESTVRGQRVKTYYIRYQWPDPKNPGKYKQIRERLGRDIGDGMTPLRANTIRNEIINGERIPAHEQKELDGGKWTISRLYQFYVDNRSGYKAKEKEKGRFTNHIEPEFGNKEPAELVSLDITRFRKKLEKKGLANQTVKNTLELLRRIINYGIKNDLIPYKRLTFDMPPVNNVRHQAMTPEQLKRYLDVIGRFTTENKEHLSNDNIEAWLLKIACYTGRRPGELCGLKHKDVFLDDNILVLHDTKAGISEEVVFSDRVKGFFEKMPKFHTVYVFPNGNGAKRTRLDHAARRFRDEAELIDRHGKKLDPAYCLRHTFMSIAASADIPDRILKSLVGHSQKLGRQDITSRYAMVTNERKLKAVNDIAREIDCIQSGSKKNNVIEMGENER